MLVAGEVRLNRPARELAATFYKTSLAIDILRISCLTTRHTMAPPDPLLSYPKDAIIKLPGFGMYMRPEIR